jgi:hypothetical protein
VQFDRRVFPVFIGTRQRAKLASYRIRRFVVQIVDTLKRAQPIAPTTIFPLSDGINRAATIYDICSYQKVN